MLALLKIIFLSELCLGSRRMYETINDNSVHTFDCLYNLITDENDLIRIQMDIHIENILFCRQSSKVNKKNIFSNHHQQWTYGELRQMNISIDQLYNWFAPLDLIEEYLLGKEEGIFVNCSQKGNSWFGIQCEYTFDSNDKLMDILWSRFDKKDFFENDLLTITNGTCYEIFHEQCQSILCLDWREICDGKLDCKTGYDERYCIELEKSDCDEINEYRCLNGQCIDKVFYHDQYPDCMDYSDEKSFSSDFCFHKFDIRCEDHSSPLMWFSCGDGYCYNSLNFNEKKFSCRSKRDDLYFQEMPSSTLILYSHLYIIYNHTEIKEICYNQLLCPYLFKENSFQITKNNLTCQLLDNTTSFDRIEKIKKSIQSCSLFPFKEECTLFQCNDGSKCLSKHRLSDSYKDCSNGEDEDGNNTCLLNHSNRFQCDHKKRCIHLSSVANHIIDCDDGSDESYTMHYLCFDVYTDQCRINRGESYQLNLSFRQICNGLLELASDSEGNTDETDCSNDQWTCSNRYTQCNHVWNCLNGKDELNCDISSLSKRHCNATSHFCLDIHNGRPKCLSLEQTNDGIIDCIGSYDERSFCRLNYPYEYFYRYRCLHSDRCISPYQICNCHQDCPFNDDETIACEWLNNGQSNWCDKNRIRCRNGHIFQHKAKFPRCDRLYFHCQDGEDELYCDLIDQYIDYGIHLKEIDQYSKSDRMKKSILPGNSLIIWYCNRGLHVRSNENSQGFVCLCPIYYYGDRCQYQRKRLTFIFQIEIFDSFDRYSPGMKFLILLIRENQSQRQILSHEEYIFNPNEYCLPKYLTHLVYPINDSLSFYSNDFIEIYLFTSLPIEYRQSWKFSIPFHFLPVQRIVKRLKISHLNERQIDHTTELLNFKINSSLCSDDSYYIGYDLNLQRNLCLCPINRIGSRCLIPYNRCNHLSCNGHGQCFPHDQRYSNGNKQVRCICFNQWFGNECEKEKFRLKIFFSEEIRKNFPIIGFVHLKIFQKFRESIDLFSLNRLNKNEMNSTYYFEYEFHENDFTGFISSIQLIKDLNHMDYYLLNLTDQSLKEISTEITTLNRCYPVKELFNETILSQLYFRRIKFYQQLCLSHKFLCFYDENFMCTCDRTNHIDCFPLKSIFNGNSSKKCSERGISIINHNLCPTSSFCLCSSCSYGSICQFSNEGYRYSLDSIIGSHIKTFHHSSFIKITFLIVIVLVLIGIFTNILSIGTFSIETTQVVGCGFYLLISSIISLITILILILKLIFLLFIKQSNFTCSLFEFILKLFRITSEWLNSCVAIERCLTILFQAKFTRLKSKRVSKWLTSMIIIFIALLSLPELIYHQIIIDQEDKQIYCVFTLHSYHRTLFQLYTISNLFVWIFPSIINFISSFIIIRETFRLKQRTISKSIEKKNRSWKENFLRIKTQLIKQKHILLGPLFLALLSIPRILFLFLFVCTKLDQRPYFSLLAYFTSFISSMSILFIFILPSSYYRTALILFLKRIRLYRIPN